MRYRILGIPWWVALAAAVSPSGQGVTATVSTASLTIPSTGPANAAFTVTTTIAGDVIPGEYVTTVTVSR